MCWFSFPFPVLVVVVARSRSRVRRGRRRLGSSGGFARLVAGGGRLASALGRSSLLLLGRCAVSSAPVAFRAAGSSRSRARLRLGVFAGVSSCLSVVVRGRFAVVRRLACLLSASDGSAVAGRRRPGFGVAAVILFSDSALSNSSSTQRGAYYYRTEGNHKH